MMKVKRIVVPTDFSEFSLQALQDAVDLGKAFKARIFLLHCVEPIYFATPDMYVPSTSVGMLLQEQRQSAEKQLARLARVLEKRRVPVRTVLATGSPHHEIVENARKLGADLIVMSTHGRSGFAHLVMGSVAEKVVRGAPCAVLTVRARKAGRARAARARRSRA
jgi:nucleotide-binding universal stress UspA family protein